MWESEEGKNLTFSIVLKPTWLEASDQFLLTKAMSLAMTDALAELLPEDSELSIKWPNDIYVGRKKVCGMLISNKVRYGRLAASIVGVGLNVNQTRFSEWLPNPISLCQAAGQFLDLDTTLDLVVEAMERRTEQLRQGADMDEEYLSHLLNWNKEACYRYQNRQITATITGVNRFGHLELRQADGAPLECDLKELTFLF